VHSGCTTEERKKVRKIARAPRWRITGDELLYRAQCGAGDLDRWLMAGVMGNRFREYRTGGFMRHITRPAARRAVVMGRLMNAGFEEAHAAEAVISWGDSGVFDLREEDIPLTLTYVSEDGTVKVDVTTVDLP
jgi:hypothetical protein